MNAIAADKPGTRNGHKLAAKKGIPTKSMVAAQEAAAKLDAVIIPLPTGGHTLVSRAEANRRALIEAERAKLEQAEADKVVEEVIAEATVQTGDKKRAASGRKAIREMAAQAQQVAEATTPAAEVVEAPAATPEPVKVKAPYNPSPLSGAPAAGQAPQKGQLPLGLLRSLVKRNPNSETLKAALAAAEAGSAAAAKKGKKAKK